MLDDEKYTPIGHRFEVSPESIIFSNLLKKIVEKNEGCIKHFYKQGYSETVFDDLSKKAIETGGRLLYSNSYGVGIKNIYIWEHGILELIKSKNSSTCVNVISTNEDFIKICEDTSVSFSSSTKKGYVFAITKGPQGNLTLTRIGYAGTPIEKTNYSSEVVKDYDYIIDDLKSKDPSGRIIILDGPAGTGKTYLIRGILMDVKNAMFVVVPPNMVSSLGGPDLLPMLLSNKEEYGKNGPTVLILEDADQCLAPRASDNMSSISTILNLGDGIFGSLFDIRIIATTNTKAKDFDPAIIREMRLSKKIHIGYLSYDEANIIYKRILKDENVNFPKPQVEEVNSMKPRNEKKTFSLAEVYKAARMAGWKPQITPNEETTVSLDEEDLIFREFEYDIDF